MTFCAACVHNVCLCIRGLLLPELENSSMRGQVLAEENTNAKKDRISIYIQF